MKKQNKQTDALKRVTIFFGYALFFLSLLTLTISTIIPMVVDIFDPAVRHLNVSLLLISLVAGAMLPSIVSYVIGDRSTHSKSKINHHFNGVLFGVASYWLFLFFSSIGAEIMSSIGGIVPDQFVVLLPVWPVIPVLAIMATIAVVYVKNKKQQPSVLEYGPYQLVLFTGLIAAFAYMLFNIFVNSDAEWILSILSIAIPAALIAISYVVLPAKNYGSSITRLTAAVVAVTLGIISVSIAGQLIPFLSYDTMAPITAGVVVWVLYLLLSRRVK